MNVVIWARVSSREQREGYSLDAQIHATRERAEKLGFTVVREFSVAESAKPGAEREAFHGMIAWVRAEAKRGALQGILAHKLDRTCRNMNDAVMLQGLERECGVRLYFCENQFGPGPAGTFSFHVLAAVGQYYSDNLRTEVLKGMDEKVRQGWPLGRAAFGYLNVPDRERPVVPDPEKAQTVVRIFEIFARGDMTLDGLPDALATEGLSYRPAQPRFQRTGLSWILNNRIYMGEIDHDGKVFASKVEPLVSRELFQRCQDVLYGRNRRTGRAEIPFSGGFFRCARCGAAMTGELIHKKQKNGVCRDYTYYRCASPLKEVDHPSIRWRAEDLDAHILTDLDQMRIPDPKLSKWLRTALEAAFADTQRVESDHRRVLHKQATETANKLDRLLSAYLEGMIDEKTYHEKQADLKRAKADIEARLSQVGAVTRDRSQVAVKLFDFSQNAGEIYRGSNSPVKREILTALTLNRTLDLGKLCLTKRKPFDVFVEGPSSSFGRGDRI